LFRRNDCCVVVVGNGSSVNACIKGGEVELFRRDEIEIELAFKTRRVSRSRVSRCLGVISIYYGGRERKMPHYTYP
jgi:hypothetical protein